MHQHVPRSAPSEAKMAPRLATVGEIAAGFGVPVHRITYVLHTRPHIRLTAIAGGARVYDSEAIGMIRHELNAVDARRVSREVADA